MAVSITLYSLSKCHNSTKQPSGTGTTYSCLLKEGTDKWNPTFIVTGDPSSNNYCSAFGMYYYIDRMEYVPPHWHLICSLDPMATWKTNIGSTSLYVLRANSVSERDIRLFDNLPTRAGPATEIAGFGGLIFPNWATGSYVVSVCGASQSGAYHYVVAPNDMKTFMEKFMSSFAWVDPGGIIDDQVKALIEPQNWIQDIRWYPFTPACSGYAETIYLGDWNTNCPADVMQEGYIWSPVTPFTLTIPKHPDAQDQGLFLNGAPYSQYTFVDPFFGTISCDASSMADMSTLTYDILVDPSCGFGHVRITADGDGQRVVIADRTGSFGVPQYMTYQSRDYLGALSADPVSTAANLVKTAFVPKTQTTGHPGSRAMYGYSPLLYCEFSRVHPVAPSRQGYPVSKLLTVGSLSGFIQVERGDVPIPGPSWAQDQIRSYLEGGFYYE